MADEKGVDTCGLWGCGRSATTPITVVHPEGGEKIVCDYHSMMVRDAR